MVSDLKTKMWFGKYKGHTIESILEENPKYLLWAHSKTSIFRMTDELIAEAEERASNDSGEWNELDLAFRDALED